MSVNETAPDFNARVHASGIFDRMDRFTPEQRAAVFYALESRWCWDCGYAYPCRCEDGGEVWDDRRLLTEGVRLGAAMVVLVALLAWIVWALTGWTQAPEWMRWTAVAVIALSGVLNIVSPTTPEQGPSL